MSKKDRMNVSYSKDINKKSRIKDSYSYNQQEERINERLLWKEHKEECKGKQLYKVHK